MNKWYWKIKDFQAFFKDNYKKPQLRKDNKPVRQFISPILSKYVRSRDEDKCFICKSTQNTESHHVMGVTEYPFLAIYPENVITLCHNCHTEYHKQYKEVNILTWSEYLKSLKITEIKEIVVQPHDLVNNDITGTILHVIRTEKGKKINHGKLLSVMKSKYGIPIEVTERDLKKLLNRKTVKDVGGEYFIK